MVPAYFRTGISPVKFVSVRLDYDNDRRLTNISDETRRRRSVERVDLDVFHEQDLL